MECSGSWLKDDFADVMLVDDRAVTLVVARFLPEEARDEARVDALLGSVGAHSPVTSVVFGTTIAPGLAVDNRILGEAVGGPLDSVPLFGSLDVKKHRILELVGVQD